MSFKIFLPYLFVMAIVTYLIRAIPLVLVKHKIKNKFFNSFLYYIPYTVLAAMTIPAIFTATGSLISVLWRQMKSGFCVEKTRGCPENYSFYSDKISRRETSGRNESIL